MVSIRGPLWRSRELSRLGERAAIRRLGMYRGWNRSRWLVVVLLVQTPTFSHAASPFAPPPLPSLPGAPGNERTFETSGSANAPPATLSPWAVSSSLPLASPQPSEPPVPQAAAPHSLHPHPMMRGYAPNVPPIYPPSGPPPTVDPMMPPSPSGAFVSPSPRVPSHGLPSHYAPSNNASGPGMPPSAQPSIEARFRDAAALPNAPPTVTPRPSSPLLPENPLRPSTPRVGPHDARAPRRSDAGPFSAMQRFPPVEQPVSAAPVPGVVTQPPLAPRVVHPVGRSASPVHPTAVSPTATHVLAPQPVSSRRR